MNINAFQVNPFGEMTYILWDNKSHQAAIIDPGMISKAETDAIDRFIADNDLRIKYLINTHLHLDHIFGNNYIEQKYDVGTSASPADAFLGEQLSHQAAGFGLRQTLDNVTVKHELHDGDVLTLGDEQLRVIATPGHSPGSISLYCPQSNFVITGDTLFHRSVGRTDLQGGDAEALRNSIRTKLFTLPDDTLVVPGHGETSYILDEKRSNPYV